MRLPSASLCAEASRCASVSIPSTGFKGLPGETNSHTWCKRKRRNICDATCRCPAWAGLNEPPSTPTRMRRRSPNRGRGKAHSARRSFRAAPAPGREPNNESLSAAQARSVRAHECAPSQCRFRLRSRIRLRRRIAWTYSTSPPRC